MKMLSRKSKRVVTLMLSAVMTLSLAACGSKQEQEQKQGSAVPQKEYVYVPEYVQVDENTDLYNMQVAGNSIYYFSYDYDEAAGTATNTLCEYSIETGEMKELPVSFGAERNVQSFLIDDQGNVCTMEYQWVQGEGMDDYSENYFLCKYDAQGNVVLEQDITELVMGDSEYAYVSNMLTDKDGNFYATSDDKILLFNKDGEFQSEIAVNGNWIQNMGVGKDGKIYVTYYDSTSGEGGYVLSEVDAAGRTLGAVYKNFPSGNGNGGLTQGVEGDFMVNDGSRVYEYDMETQSTTELLAWLDSDINGTYVNYIGVLENGKLFAVINDWSTNKTEIAALTKTKYAELPEKQQVVIGTLYDDQALQAAAVAFNKQSESYRITIKTYIDQNNWTESSYSDAIVNLNNDIISGSNCPDILDISQLNIAQLSAKGVFEDLNPYFEKSTKVKTSDFLDSVINAYTMDGKLISVPNTFQLGTVVGKASEVGTEMGWTLEEMIAYAEEHPDAMVFDNASKSSMMYYMLSYNQDEFIDWTTGKCKFDSEDFIRILEFIGKFPDEVDWEADQRSTPAKLQAGDVLLDVAGISELNNIQQYDAMFEEAVTFIGFPNSEGNSGCYITGNSLFAIASKSENKDGAWAFIEHYLSKEPDNMFSWGLPSRKADLDKLIEEETKIEYLLDENGQQVLDENGEPIVMGGGGGIGYGDWEYTFHVCTQEEVDRVLELIEVAVPISNANEEIMTIIDEEAQAFFQGQKSAADVAGVIQSRVQVYVNENR